MEILHHAQIGQNTYKEYARYHIYTYRQIFVLSSSVGLAQARPNNMGYLADQCYHLNQLTGHNIMCPWTPNQLLP